MKTRILIVDDHPILRRGIQVSLRDREDIEIVGEASDGQSAIEKARELRPDLIIMDVIMPHMSGIEASHQILAEMPEVKILILSICSDRQYVMDLLKLGVKGYIPKYCLTNNLIDAIHTLIAGQTYLSPEIATIVVDERIHDHSLDQLTSTETKILRLLADGKSTRELADKFEVNIKTIEAHRRRIMKKLGVQNFVELLKYAIKSGLTSC